MNSNKDNRGGKFLLNILLCLFFSTQSIGQEKKQIFSMFYNVENFFDTIDDKTKNDNEFLPDAKKNWNTKKYNHKKKQLTKVISSINGGEMPNLIGLCEVENKEVIEDLLKEDFFKESKYKIIHKESPDQRGIDCALIVDENFKILNSKFIEIKLPGNSKPTRDIIHAKLKLNNEIVHVFVNHWPSRWGGTEKTESKRIFVADKLKKYINKNIKSTDFIIVMGDLNDYPNNYSVKNVLVENTMENLCSLKNWDNEGSYIWDSKWDFLDQIIVSKNFLKKDSKIKVMDFDVFNEEWLLYTKKDGTKTPNRTYGGSNWYGGFSDHLPVYSLFELN